MCYLHTYNVDVLILCGKAQLSILMYNLQHLTSQYKHHGILYIHDHMRVLIC